MKKRFYVFSAGCIRRGLDTIHMQRYFQVNGWALTRWIRRADLIIVATCGVVRLNEINSLKGIAEAARKKRASARIVVTGCLPIINPEEIHKLGDFICVPTKQDDKLDAIIQAKIPYAEVAAPDSITDNPDIVNYLVARSFCRRSTLYKKLFHAFSMNGRFLAVSVSVNRAIEYLKSLISKTPCKKVVPYFNIKIGDGCMSECTFCATRFATGQLRSRPKELIIADFRSGLEKGYKIFQLIAEDTGCYGLDIGSSLADLLKTIFAIEGDYQLVIIDCCPQWLVEQHDEIIPVLVAHQDKIKELFVPVQSGCDRVLQRMKRKYTARQVTEVLKELNERAPALALRTSLLIGFPGETDRDFEDTKQFLQGIKFAEVTVNRYEDRPNTESSAMADKVRPETIEARAQFLADKMGCRVLS